MPERASEPSGVGRTASGAGSPSMALVERAAILGVGLMGGSLGLRWRQSGAVSHVVGFSRTPERLHRALELGAIDELAPDIATAVTGADLVVLCTPIRAAMAMAPAVVAAAGPGCLITDVGSTKAAISRAMAEVMAARGRPAEDAPVFVGGHPMAGTEKAGVEAADPYLFEQAVWVVCPQPGGPASATELLCHLVAATGAHPVCLDPERHDARVAAISHLPQLCAVALAEAAGLAESGDSGVLSMAGGGFRDTTRIAESPAEFWLDVLETNRFPVLAQIDQMQALLEALRIAVAHGDRATVAQHFEAARAVRQRVPSRQKGLLPAYHDLVLFVPDRPGVLGRLCGVLGERGINVQDIEILRLREGEGGTLRLGFAAAEAAAEALVVLRELGYAAQHR